MFQEKITKGQPLPPVESEDRQDDDEPKEPDLREAADPREAGTFGDWIARGHLPG